MVKWKDDLSYSGILIMMGLLFPFRFAWLKTASFFDGKINAVGTGWGSTVYDKARSINTAVRNIKILELPPGSYSAVITTLEDVPAFHGIESFVEFTYYNPKI
ncbi:MULTISPECIES: DUF5625 family protein [Photorhabdus]|uniref:DUF5625 family protein n=1 Tax=Photorhabdus TaxID=29487 RepID=UPI0028F70AFB|nr:DUF5625 family protein [Photorhabdus kleinii]